MSLHEDCCTATEKLEVMLCEIEQVLNKHVGMRWDYDFESEDEWIFMNLNFIHPKEEELV